MIEFKTIAYFRNRLEVLLKVKKGVYATVVEQYDQEKDADLLEDFII